MSKRVFFVISALAILLSAGHIFTIGYGFGYDAISRAEMSIEQAKRYQPSHLAVIYERTVDGRSDLLHLEIDTTYRAIGSNAFHYKMICDREITVRAFDGEYADCSEIAANCFVFAENNRKWQLGRESRTIIDQECNSATTTIDGEEYKAWYATALPHCDKDAQQERRLEGLILEARSANGSYTLKAKYIAQHLG